ncbi:hypothetical protein UFOVP332_9 [uncultured Caudovirales phage]|uniref:Uncharacterized protein n=1 Tax=uncultured Caudovirales phage TaxID=2100421 RepID=A0A6J5MRL8_9CAUD|nr:hypothetical protein UFOVP332_9 [uncultured Caudovirales phage]CAB4149378.1 hypothetical protein UFOVP541_17 [uncultured Caudovirales phage]
MAASTRIKAQNIHFRIAGTDYACDANLVQLTLDDAPGDVQTFCEVRVGGQWSLQLDGITSGESTSLYRLLWDNFGTEVAFSVQPQGNAVATAEAPHYEGTVVFDQLPPLALVSNETAVFSVTLQVKNTPHDPASSEYYGVTIQTA